MKYYEKTVRDWEKACEKNKRMKNEKAKKEEKKSSARRDGEVEKLRREIESMEREEQRLKGIPEPPVICLQRG